MSDIASIWSEVKRRNVIRVAIAYIVVGIAVGSAAELFLENLDAPDWFLKATLILIILGLPIAVVLAWAYERTPEGLVRDTGTSAASVDKDADRVPDAKSIAVLPFANMSDDPENEFFADGVAEDILMRLSQVSALHVISRTSAMVYKGANKPVAEIARELGVGSVLEGSVRRSGGRVRVVAQLIDASTDGHLWAETFDRELADIFAVQSEISEQIAAALNARLAPEQADRLKREPTRNLKAYELFLRGRSAALALKPDNMEEGIALLEAAIDLDPGFTDAIAMLAWAHSAATYYATGDPRKGFQRALEIAQQALEQDPDHSLALMARGVARYHLWDWFAAEKDLHRAVELDPGSSDSQMWLGHFLNISGRFKEAIDALRKAKSLAPQEPVPAMQYALATFYSGQQEQGLRAIHEAIDIDPNFFESPAILGVLLVELGRYDEALEALELGVALSDRHPFQLGFLAVASSLAGKTEMARRLADELDVEHPLAGRTGPAFAAIARGELDEAVDHLEALAEARQPIALWIPRIRWADRILVENARYVALKARIWPS
jgi:TolB-like protein/Flp pilus assembly protein TadD